MRSGSLPWRPELAAAADRLRQEVAAAAPEHFAAAVDAEVKLRAGAFLRGIERYRHHPYRRSLAEPRAIWQAGTSRLLDYGRRDGAPLLVVPSLVNRAYILDLAEDKSLLRFLVDAGHRPLLVDWGEPGASERRFTLTNYIVDRLEPAAEAAAAAAKAPLSVLGYCMGGLLAVALAQRRPTLVGALALLATPWDFHAERGEHARLLGKMAAGLACAFAGTGVVPVDVLQVLFAALDPLLALRKFSRFATLSEGSGEERDFVAVEDWLNDGVPLALAVVQECLGGWYGANTTARARWRVADRPITPARVNMPSLVVVPAQDRIVPPATAAVLADLLPSAERLTPAMGHIGMVVGREAPSAVWQPLAQWLLRQANPRRRERAKKARA